MVKTLLIDCDSRSQEHKYTNLEEFLIGVTKIVVGLVQLKEEHYEELKEAGVLHDSSSPKWARRKRGDKRPSDRYDYGEK